MKSTYIIGLAIIIVVGSILWLNMGPKEAVAPTKTDEATGNIPALAPQTETPTAAEHGMTAEEHAAMMGESTQGTDVGMGMPETTVTTDPAPAPMGTMDHSTMSMDNTGTTKTFMVDGTDFAFDVKEIKVKEGDTVTIHFTSADGFHDLVIDEFNAKTEKVRTGGMSMVTFVASKKGTFEYYCSVGQHRMNGMVGKLIVE